MADVWSSSPASATRHWRASPGGRKPYSSRNRPELPPESITETTAVTFAGRCRRPVSTVCEPVPPPTTTILGLSGASCKGAMTDPANHRGRLQRTAWACGCGPVETTTGWLPRCFYGLTAGEAVAHPEDGFDAAFAARR